MSQKIEINIRAIDDASSKIGSMAKNIDRSLDDVGRASEEVVRNQKDLERAVTSTADNSSRQVDKASREIDSDFDDINRSSDEVVANQRELERAVDDTSRNAAGDVDTAAKEITKDYADVGRAADEVKTKHKSMGEGTKDVVTGFSGVATAGFSLYNAYDRVSDMTLQVDKANLAVTRSAETLNDTMEKQKTQAEAVDVAQQGLNEAIQTYGSSSGEAQVAQELLDKAVAAYDETTENAAIQQEAYNIKVDAAKQTQDNFNEAIIQSALQIVPTTITMVDSFAKIQAASAAAAGAQGIGAVNTALTTLKGIGSLIIPITVVIAAVWAIQQALDWIKEAVIYPSAPGLKGFEQLQPPALGGVRVPGMQHGGIVTQPTLAVVGEAGPEAVIPLNRASMAAQQNVTNNFHVNIEGSVDERTLRVLEKRLKNVMVEATSSKAAAGHNRIRLGVHF